MNGSLKAVGHLLQPFEGFLTLAGESEWYPISDPANVAAAPGCTF